MARKSFDQWMKEVDQECKARYGLSIYDLADCPFHDWYDDGKTPKGAASAAWRMNNEG